MTDPQDRIADVRVLNLSALDLPCAHLLKRDARDTATQVKAIRRYADRPFVYVVDREGAEAVPELLAALKATRSSCFPYALFPIDGAELDIDMPDLDVIPLDTADAGEVCRRIEAYVASRLTFDSDQLCIGSDAALPAKVDVVIVGAGITGIYAANRLQKAGLSFAILESRDRVGGIWSRYANTTSQVNSSEGAYRLVEKRARSNRDHSYTREMLEDIVALGQKVKDHLFLETEVTKIEKDDGRYRTRIKRDGQLMAVESTGVILAINDRVGAPREMAWPRQAVFSGQIVSGISDDARGIEWRDKKVVIVGMGAFAIENARTALEAGARHVTVVCRRHGTVCPKIIDYLNFATPYDEAFKHDKKSNMRNMMYWKKLYDLSGATQPECWMGKIKHDGHTISVSDIWFIGHYLKKIKTVTGEITTMTADGIVVNGQQPIPADVVVNCVGFERNAPCIEALSGYREIYDTNYVDKDFMYLADAYIDRDAFNSLFGSSVLEMVKFYMEVFVMFFERPAYGDMLQIAEIQKNPITERKWSHYIRGAMVLIQHFPPIRDIAWQQVDKRTANFLETHDLETYIAQNKREWRDMHAMLAGRPMQAEDCLPYVFERLIAP